MDASLLPPGPSRAAVAARPRECVVVRGGGVAVVTLGAGDAIAIRDGEGLQPALVFAIDGAGRADGTALGLEGPAEARLADLLDLGERGARRFCTRWRRGGSLRRP